MLLLRSIACAATLAFAASSGTAATFGPATFGIADPDQTVGFDEIVLDNGTAVTDQYAEFGVTFSPAVYFIDRVSPRAGFEGAAALNFGQGQVSEPFSILFESVVDAASFAFTWSGDALFEAKLGGDVVESFTADARLNDDNFFGFSGIRFDEIRISRDPDSFDRTGALDTISFSVAVVPLPASALLMLGALGAVGLVSRRRAA